MSHSRSQALAKAFFVYGCLTTPLALYVHISVALLRWRELPDLLLLEGSVDIWIWFVGAHAMTFVVTLATDPMAETDPRWVPIVQPSEGSILIGRIIVLAVSCNVLYWVTYIYVTRDVWGATAFLTATLLLSTTYTAVHWALRPENIFSWRVLKFFRSPLGFLMSPLSRMTIARRRAIPLREWLPELLRCCEVAANSSRLVDSETPSVGEVDSVEFQYRLLDELQSRVCLIHYRKDLSRHGYKEIRRFIRSVESLRHPSPAQGQWQGVVRDARAVLSVRESLVEPGR